MSRTFWIILAIIVVGLAGVFLLVKPEADNTATFTGDAAQIQPDDHVRNNTQAKVTLIEYGDFQCPSCGAFYPVLKQLEQQFGDQVNFVFRHYPIISIHPNAFAAARAAEAASSQGKFFEMHDLLYENQQAWGQSAASAQGVFEGYAQQLGLDMEKFKQDYASAAVADRINRDISSGKQFDITGTPTFILNGEKIENPKDATAFAELLQKAVDEAAGAQPTPAQ